jgi:hypothetical protein
VALHRPLPSLAHGSAAQDDTSEPRFTSAEWWIRENARLGKAVAICRGCLPAVVATVTPPKAVFLDPGLPVLANPALSRVEDAIPPDRTDP